MIRNAVMACILAGAVGSAASATTVEFRVVEMRNQLTWTGTSFGYNTLADGTPNNTLATGANVANDEVLNFAVQARVVGGAPGEALGNFGFDILTNDAQNRGTFTRATISTAAGTYTSTNPATGAFSSSNSVGRGGLAAIYTYLAGVNPNFNGLINTSAGSFTENPAVNDLGLVTGSPTGNSLLLLTDSGGTGNPDTYPGSGTTAPLDPTIADTYLGADNHFVDLYHFNYYMSSNQPRVITFSIANAQAQTFLNLAVANGVWGPNNPVNAMAVLTTGASVTVTPAPGAAALLGLGGLIVGRRRRTA